MSVHHVAAPEPEPVSVAWRSPHVPGADPALLAWQYIGVFDADVALDEARSFADRLHADGRYGCVVRAGVTWFAVSRAGVVEMPVLDVPSWPATVPFSRWERDDCDPLVMRLLAHRVDRRALVGACARAALAVYPDLARRCEAGDALRAVLDGAEGRGIEKHVRALQTRMLTAVGGPTVQELKASLAVIAARDSGWDATGAILLGHNHKTQRAACAVIRRWIPTAALWCLLADVTP